MLSYIHYKIRTTPWLGRFVLRMIPNWKWSLHIRPIGKFVIRIRQHRMFWLRPPLAQEEFMLGSLQRLIRPGDVVYDLGANIGLYTRIMIQCFGASHVYAFEPIQSNRILLAENLAIPGCASQATIVGCAVGDEDGTADFQIDDLTSNSGTLDAVTRGAASQSRSQYGLPPATTRVTISRLDTLIATQGLTAPGVMKLDVEGAEALALRGAKHLLSVQKPRLVVELHGAKFARQVLEILWSLGYHCFGRLNMNDASTYKELTLADLESMTNRGPIPYIAASCAYEDLTQPIENFHVSERSR